MQLVGNVGVRGSGETGQPWSVEITAWCGMLTDELHTQLISAIVRLPVVGHEELSMPRDACHVSDCRSRLMCGKSRRRVCAARKSLWPSQNLD